MAASPEFRVATPDDVVKVAAAMRPADAAEVLASGGYTPEGALVAAVEASDFARVLVVDGEPIAMFGVLCRGALAIPWLLTTTGVDRHRRAFWRASKHALAKILEHYPVLVQQVDARYTAALRWAQRLGFDVHPPAPFGVAGLPFCQITLEASDV
jgi:hypothetical protein